MEDKYKISIPEPCHENWDKMKPIEQGRFCESCCKAVVDFTSKSTDEIIQYLLKKKESVCGRAYNDQLSPIPIKNSPRSRWRIFTAAILFVFGSFLFSSCRVFRHNRQLSGKFLVEPKHPEKQNPLLTPDRIKAGSGDR